MKRKVQFFVLLITFITHFSITSNVAFGGYKYSTYSNNYSADVKSEANLLAVVGGVLIGIVAVGVFVAGFTNGWNEQIGGEQLAILRVEENSNDFSKFDPSDGRN
jgi:hypothetical protein